MIKFNFRPAPIFIPGILIGALLVNLFSCSSQPSKSLAQASGEPIKGSDLLKTEITEKNQPSSLDIDYYLERDRYRLSFQNKAGHISVEKYHDGKVIEKGEIDGNKYSSLVEKTAKLMKTFKNESNLKLPCLNPFVISIVLENKAEHVKGCRSRDDGNLSKLIREGEFLLYSKNL
jgi:hypothetical protein